MVDKVALGAFFLTTLRFSLAKYHSATQQEITGYSIKDLQLQPTPEVK